MSYFQRLMMTGLFVFGLAVCSADTAEAGDWIFARSYYSHADSPGYAYGIAPEAESAYRRPYRNPAPHAYIRGGYRINNVRIFNGSNSDIEYEREAWYNVN